MALAAFSFGPFQLDERSLVLRREGDTVDLTHRHVSLLLLFTSHAGTLLTKDALVSACWGDVAVTDNSVEQAISRLRRVLGRRPDGRPYIETVPRQGYRFTAKVERIAAHESPAAIDALLAPQRVWLDGHDALDTLEQTHLVTARQAFQQLLTARSDDARAHIGFANACLYQFESTRVDEHPDAAALAEAQQHAYEACRLDSESAEAWATLAFALHSAGASDPVAAAWRAVSLEPTSWKHFLRLAVVSWGEARLQAAERTLQLLPGLALAHWLAATVHVARPAFRAAERDLDAGAVAQDAQSESVTRFGAVGLHWLRGLVRLHHGDETGAYEAFQRELTFESRGHLYGRECCANTWYALGALFLRQGARDKALHAFGESLRRVDDHLMPLTAQALLGARDPATVERAITKHLKRPRCHAAQLEAALAVSLRHAWAGQRHAAARSLQHALHHAGPGAAGWEVPVEPMLAVSASPELWADVLTKLRARAA